MNGSLHPANHLSVHLLDTFQIELNNLPIDLPTRKIENLFAYLLLHPEAHAREKLAALYWGDSPQDDARASLRQALSVLRRHIDQDLLLADRETVQIAPTFPIWVDVLNFQNQAQQFLAEPTHTGEPFDCAFYMGDLLPDDYDDWIFPLREHYHALYIDVMLRSVELLRAKSEYTRAIEYAQQILEIDRANERAHQHLMFCYITTGERNKALQQYATCQQALLDELDIEPARETQALYHWIKETVTSIPSRAARITNLPIPISSFVGRQHELTEIKRLLSTMRLVTLTGVGGSGKTRLAIHAATDLIDAYRDGVWWVELAPLSEASLVPYAVARALGIETEAKKSAVEFIAHFLQNRQVLLVLDNCEHLIEACAELVNTLLNECEGLKVLATSREALRVMGEQVWLAPALSAPNVEKINLVDIVMRYEAVQLFVERTRAVRPDYVISESDALAVAQICQRLDGIPLAIELAAARMKMMSASQIAARLDDQFRLLTSGPRTAENRHRTLRAAVDWSYELLSAHEQILFNRLSIFAGGWTIHSAEAICAGKGIEAKMVFELLAHLVDKSLISVDESGERYTMLETMKAYGREKLEEVGEEDWVLHKYLEYFLDLAETADKKLRGPEQLVWLEQLNLERDNFSSAMLLSLDHPDAIEKGIRLVCILAYYWGLLGEVNTSRYWLEKGFVRSESLGKTATRANMLFNMAYWQTFTIFDQSPLEIQKMIEECRAIWEELGPGRISEIGKCLLVLGYLRKYTFNDDQGIELLKESNDIFQKEGEIWWQAWASTILVDMYRDSPSNDLHRFLDEEARLWQDLGDRNGLACCSWNLGDLALSQGKYIEAERYYLDSLALFEELGSKGFALIISRNLGSVKRGLQHYEKAEWYYKNSIPYARKEGQDFRFSMIYLGLGFIALRKNDLLQAEKYLLQTFQLSLDMELIERILLCIAGFASIEVLRENLSDAALWFGAYSTLFERFRQHPDRIIYRCPVTLLDIEYFISLCREQMEREAFEQAWNEGCTLTLDELVEEVLSMHQAVQ